MTKYLSHNQNPPPLYPLNLNHLTTLNTTQLLDVFLCQKLIRDQALHLLRLVLVLHANWDKSKGYFQTSSDENYPSILFPSLCLLVAPIYNASQLYLDVFLVNRKSLYPYHEMHRKVPSQPYCANKALRPQVMAHR